MIQRLSYNPMPDWALDHLRASYAHRARVAGHWWITRNSLKSRYNRQFRLDGSEGRYRLRLRVYGRTGEPCPRCREVPIRRRVVQGRSTFDCPRCQR
jgi:formamidopyrimidine-DNA glycosylase